MERRDFLSRLLGVGAMFAVSPCRSSSLPYWSGWREIPNQCFTFGYWASPTSPDEHGNLLISLTTGSVRRYHELEVLDLTHAKGWPILLPWSTEEERECAKQRALDNLRQRM